MGAKGMGFVRADGVSDACDVDEAAVGRGVSRSGRIVLIVVAEVEPVLGAGLPVNAAQVLLVGREERHLTAELGKRYGARARNSLVRNSSNLAGIASGDCIR